MMGAPWCFSAEAQVRALLKGEQCQGFARINGLFHLGRGPVVCRVRCSPSRPSLAPSTPFRFGRPWLAKQRTPSSSLRCGLSSHSHSDPGLAASPLSCRPREPEQPHPRSKPSPHPHTAVLCCFLSFATSTCTNHSPL